MPRAETVKGFAGILEGRYDDLPENLFYNAGTIAEVETRAK